jgi:delta24-sterol reductase
MTFTHQVFQDITLPMTDLEKSIELSEELFDTYPVLVYPCKIIDHKRGPQGQLRAPRKADMQKGEDWGMFFDLGVYGVPGAVQKKLPYNPTATYKRMEEHIREVGGYPFLYADTWFTEEEFEECFDLTLWREARAKFRGTCLGSFWIGKCYCGQRPRFWITHVPRLVAGLKPAYVGDLVEYYARFFN